MIQRTVTLARLTVVNDTTLGRYQAQLRQDGRAETTSIWEAHRAQAGKVKYASAHDLRRSFGERWSSRVMPNVLQELMRHENYATTMRYYIGQKAKRAAAILWEAHH
ncbi:MAG: tyrosine-type recombinase/integrase, partial [Pirellulaceae bacterium]|nr:tyrosine-type recombinase/integrase [Pirellulaceae bacterium]